MLAKVRAFFAKREVLEVDTSILSQSAPIDPHIDVMTVQLTSSQKAYLHTSAEYGMKRLLCEYPIDMYQLSHVFREEEKSRLHNPEFTMIEWYRNGYTLPQLMQETVLLIELFLGPCTPIILSFQELFQQFVQMNPFTVTQDQIYIYAMQHHLIPSSLAKTWDLDTWLYYFMGCVIEPQLKGLYIIHSFPPSWAALATVRQEGAFPVACRFEIFFNGIELANGFEELQDPAEQRGRLYQHQEDRLKLGKTALPIDENFLAALEKGLPPCCGVAAGFDRLFMLFVKSASLQDILPLSWDECSVIEARNIPTGDS